MADLAVVATSLPNPANIDGFYDSSKLAGEDIPGGSVVGLNAVGRWMLYKAADEATTPVRGITAKTVKSGEPVSPLIFGAFGGFTGLTPGQNVYTSVNEGKVANATSAGAKWIGYAKNATTIQFNFLTAPPV